ncbi:MAG TPA: hypothetical protein VL977_01295, partial [Solirubrobacteraceae bacterium]|nr:hypothetical protein [Solirubrobacteraceae bacterium]
ARILARTVAVLLHGGDLYRGATGGWDLPPVDGYEAAATGAPEAPDATVPGRQPAGDSPEEGGSP